MARTDMRVLRQAHNRLQEAIGACDRARDVILHIAAWYGYHNEVLPRSETDDPHARPSEAHAHQPLFRLSFDEMASLMNTLSDLPANPMATIRRMRGLSAMREEGASASASAAAPVSSRPAQTKKDKKTKKSRKHGSPRSRSRPRDPAGPRDHRRGPDGGDSFASLFAH